MFLKTKDHYIFMQRELHETEILKRLQPGLVHDKKMQEFVTAAWTFFVPASNINSNVLSGSIL